MLLGVDGELLVLEDEELLLGLAELLLGLLELLLGAVADGLLFWSGLVLVLLLEEALGCELCAFGFGVVLDCELLTAELLGSLLELGVVLVLLCPTAIPAHRTRAENVNIACFM